MKHGFAWALIAGASLAFGGCAKKEEAPAVKTVSFINDVAPILQASCLECHKAGGSGQIASGLLMSTETNPDVLSYESLMKGTKYGSIITPGNSLASALNMLVEGRADPSIRMPHGKDPLTEEQIATLKNWVDQGAKNN
jgi:hypothetical protein